MTVGAIVAASSSNELGGATGDAAPCLTGTAATVWSVLLTYFSSADTVSISGARLDWIRSIRVGSSRKKSVAGMTIAAITTLATARKPSRHSIAASTDGTRRRSNHSRIGTSATAITSEMVSGRKNSDPALSAKGSASTRPTAAVSVSPASSRSRLSEINAS